jgi:hypothetical protein
MFQFRIDPQKTALFFLAIVVSLIVVHSLAMTVSLYSGNQDVMEITEYVDLDIEKNIPSLYSAFALFLCSLLFFCISSLEKKQGRRHYYWWGLACIFLFLSFDEAFALHEGFGDLTEKYIEQTGVLEASGLLYFPWILPYGFLTGILGIFYVRFLFRLPRKTAGLLVLSAVIFLTGAGFFDMLGGREAELNGYYSVTYTILYTIEEFLEMSGIVLLMFTLLDYIEQQHGQLCLSLQERKKQDP